MELSGDFIFSQLAIFPFCLLLPFLISFYCNCNCIIYQQLLLQSKNSVFVISNQCTSASPRQQKSKIRHDCFHTGVVKTCLQYCSFNRKKNHKKTRGQNFNNVLKGQNIFETTAVIMTFVIYLHDFFFFCICLHASGVWRESPSWNWTLTGVIL